MSNTIAYDLSPAMLAAAIEENEIQNWLYRACAAGWEVHQDSHFTWYYSGLDEAKRNGVLRTTLPADSADDYIAKMMRWFASRSVPMSWWDGPFRPADLGARLTAHGFISHGGDPGMAADLDALNEDVSLPAGFVVERVRDIEATRLWLRVFLIAHDSDPDVSHVPLIRYSPVAFDDADPLRLYIARVNGEPVAAAQMLFAAGVAGLYCVCTTPSARRQGVGAGVTLAALQDARAAGYHIGVLGSSQMGVGVYRRLGFREYCKLTLYTLEP